MLKMNVLERQIYLRFNHKYKIHTVQQTRLFLYHHKTNWCNKCVLHLITFCPLTFFQLLNDKMREENEQHNTIENRWIVASCRFPRGKTSDLGLVLLTKLAIITSSQDHSLQQRVVASCNFLFLTTEGHVALVGKFANIRLWVGFLTRSR